MTNTASLTASLLVLVSACAGTGDTNLPTKSELGGKSDADTSEVCRRVGQPADCDICEEMGWYGDGTCDSFCKNPDPDCGTPIPAGITSHLSGGALPIHPQLGVWVITRPGVFDSATWYRTAAEVAAGGAEFAVRPVTCAAVERGLSTFDACSEESMPSTTCKLNEASYAPISTYHAHMVEYDLGMPSAEDVAKARATDGAIDYMVQAEHEYVKYYYGVIDGQLYLLVIDTASLDCSA
jgi:hypothetical protein